MSGKRTYGRTASKAALGGPDCPAHSSTIARMSLSAPTCRSQGGLNLQLHVRTHLQAECKRHQQALNVVQLSHAEGTRVETQSQAPGVLARPCRPCSWTPITMHHMFGRHS